MQRFQFTDVCNGNTGRSLPAMSRLFQLSEMREKEESMRVDIAECFSAPPFMGWLMHFLPDIVLFRGFPALPRAQSAVSADRSSCNQNELG